VGLCKRGSGENYIIKSLMICTFIFRVIKSRRMRWAGNVACMGNRIGVCRILVGKPEGKRTLVSPRYRWEDNIKVDLKGVGLKRGCRFGVRIGTDDSHL
jgi:hypothetical protein